MMATQAVQPHPHAIMLARCYTYLLRRADELEQQNADDSTLAGASSAASDAPVKGPDAR